VSIIVFSSLASSIDIQTHNETMDINGVSPDSEVAQIVKVVDSQGNMINNSVLLNETGNKFQFEYTGGSDNFTDVEYLSEGYYYGFFNSGSNGGTINYRIVDQSPGGGTTTESEDLWKGPLSMSLQNNYTSKLEAGALIDIAVEAENLATYYYVDGDENGQVSSNDVLVADSGGEGTYSSKSDEVLVGSWPAPNTAVSGNNPWSDRENSISMNDSSLGDDWNPGSDIIVLDYNSGGTVSTQPDDPLNTGDNSVLDAEPGKTLIEMNEISSNKFYVSNDASFDQGDITVFNNDSDGNYTSQSDDVLAGKSDYPIGTQVTYSGQAPTFMEIASHDSNTDGEAWNPNEDVIVHNRDQDNFFTRSEDRVLSGTEPAEAAKLNTSTVDYWNNGQRNTPQNGNLGVIDADEDGGAWNSSEDGMWIEDGTNPGFQSSEDTLIIGNPPSGVQPDTNGDLFSKWPDISGYDSSPGDNYTSANDAIVMDYNSGGTYSKNEDVIISGTPSGFSEGSTFTNSEGFSSDWNIAIIDSIEDNGEWSSDVDTILKDRNNGGTYSPYPDTVINSGDSTSSGGTDLKELNSISSDRIMWADVNENGVYDSGDEILRDRDGDGLYTNRSDKHLAGLSLNVAGEGTGLTTSNLWQTTPYDDTPILFVNDDDSGFNEKDDVIFHDLDEDGEFTARRDAVIDGDTSGLQNGDSIISADANTSQLDPNIKAFVTAGSETTGPIELGTNEEGLYVGELQVPDLHDQKMLLQITAETSALEYGSMISQELSTRPEGIGFSLATNQVNLEINKKGQYEKSVNVENLLEENNRLNLTVDGEISNITELDSEVELQASETGKINATFNISEMNDKEGEIVVKEEDTGISDTIDVEINTPNCSSKTMNLCRTDEGPVEILTEERENLTSTVELLNIGQKGSEREVELDVEGNISDYVKTENTSVSFTGSKMMEIEFIPSRPGNYTGEFFITSDGEDIIIPLSLSANFVELETKFEVKPEEIDIGAVPVGEDTDVQNIMIENTGTLELKNTTFKSSSYTISQTNPGTISTSNSENYTLTFESLESIGSSIEVVGYSERGKVTKEVPVTGSTVKPISEMRNEINTKISNLRAQANSTETMSTLTEVETQVSSIQTSWDKGEYSDARSKYETALADLNSVEAQVSRQNTGGAGTGGETGTQESSDEGSGGILILLLLLIIILGAGFIVYTSYYPEEGDPLYDVLGDREE